ncbi:hypothetical protein KC19_VG021200 [Ceratodon purpureus]|uniref:Uncharacterized protein n=1 Tax=Ceratodon purpureus TaxID=3225 RepID=A0A8T0HL54_CERPU|nr:hypothetical protein KC19_VG021200 [Ceratodon purpureus]
MRRVTRTGVIASGGSAGLRYGGPPRTRWRQASGIRFSPKASLVSDGFSTWSPRRWMIPIMIIPHIAVSISTSCARMDLPSRHKSSLPLTSTWERRKTRS